MMFDVAAIEGFTLKVNGLMAQEERDRDKGGRARRLVDGGDPESFCAPPQVRAFVNQGYIDRGGNPDSEYAVYDDWREAPDIERIALALVAKHRRFAHLRDKALVFRWKREGGATGGKDTLGKCVKLSGVSRIWSSDDFLIWLAADHARFYALSHWQLEALICHELCHAGETSKQQPTLTPHDATIFVFEVEQYGLWMRDLELVGRAAARAVKQMALWDDGDDAGGE